MTSDAEIEILAARVRLRIAYIAAGMEDLHRQEGLRRVLLSPRLTVYAHLYCVSVSTLLDVDANNQSLDGLFEEHSSRSSVVREFNVANGTNVRLRQGESVICCGNDELVSMKLTQDGVVTYRDAAASRELLQQALTMLDRLVREGLYRGARILYSPTLSPSPKRAAGEAL